MLVFVIWFTFVLFWVLQVSRWGRGARKGAWGEGAVAQWTDAAGGVCAFGLIGFVMCVLCLDLLGVVLTFLFVVRSCMRVQCRLFSVRETLG